MPAMLGRAGEEEAGEKQHQTVQALLTQATESQMLQMKRQMSPKMKMVV